MPNTDATPTLLMRRAFLEGRRGLVYGPVDLRSEAMMTLIVGGRGSGLTSLLLSAAGRMTPTAGSIATLGHDVAGQASLVRSLVGIAGFDMIDGLDAHGTVGAHLRQRWSWNRPWYARRPRADDAWTRKRLGALFGPVRVPDAATRVEDLAEDQRLLLRVALALIDQPRILAIDNLDGVVSPEARIRVMGRLAWLNGQGFPIVAATHDGRDVELMRRAGATDVKAFHASDGTALDGPEPPAGPEAPSGDGPSDGMAPALSADRREPHGLTGTMAAGTRHGEETRR